MDQPVEKSAGGDDDGARADGASVAELDSYCLSLGSKPLASLLAWNAFLLLLQSTLAHQLCDSY